MIKRIWWGADSVVYYYPWMETCYKAYHKKELSCKSIYTYHEISNQIRDIVMQSDISDQVEILYLDEKQIWEACSINRKGEIFPVSNIKYIDWEKSPSNYKKTLSILWKSNIKEDIKKIISKNLSQVNIKPVSESKVIITDLWATIVHFIEEYLNIKNSNR